MPRKSFSDPIGTWIGTAVRENLSWMLATVLSNEARSRSSMVATRMTGRSKSWAYFQTRSVITCTPETE